MKYKIDNTEYELRFGIGFVRELNHIAGVEASGMSLGMALTKALPGLRVYDPSILADVIYAAAKNKVNTSRPSRLAIEEALDSEKDIEKVFDGVTEEIAKSNAIKAAAKNLKA